MTSARDERIFVHGASWATYEALLVDRGERVAPRMTYLDGELELMSPSRFHERIKETLATLCVLYCHARGVTVQALGSWTVSLRRDEAGAEPDACYVFGRGERTRPDLAIEVVWTSGGLEKLEVYRRLGVPEVWIWEAGAITVHVLVADRYDVQPRSSCLPGFDLAVAAELAQLESITDALGRWQSALR